MNSRIEKRLQTHNKITQWYNNFKIMCMWFTILGYQSPLPIEAPSRINAQHTSSCYFIFDLPKTPFPHKWNIKCSLIVFVLCFHFRYSVRSVMHKYLEKENEISFDKIFNQILGKSFRYQRKVRATKFACFQGALLFCHFWLI